MPREFFLRHEELGDVIVPLLLRLYNTELTRPFVSLCGQEVFSRFDQKLFSSSSHWNGVSFTAFGPIRTVPDTHYGTFIRTSAYIYSRYFDRYGWAHCMTTSPPVYHHKMDLTGNVHHCIGQPATVSWGSSASCFSGGRAWSARTRGGKCRCTGPPSGDTFRA